MNSQTPTQVGPYQVVRILGQGGMGVVYEVRHPEQPGRRLALKLLLTDDPPRELLARFKREAEVLELIEHPNVIGVVDFNQAPDGKPYLVCDFVAGKTLRELCRDDPMEPEQAARIVRDLSDALGELHKRQILHRDIKPENIMLSEDGEPMLLDFGLAKDLDGERLTVTGSILGTPSYMAPEQAEGSGRLDSRTDVYGLGATLFFLLCGRPPFRGRQPMAVLRQVLLEEPVWPTGDEREDQRIRREAAQAAATPAPKPAPQVFNQDATVWNASADDSDFQQDRTVIGALAETDVAASRPPGALAPPGSTDFQEDATMLSVPGQSPSQLGPPGADPTFFSSPGVAPGSPASQPSTARLDLDGTLFTGPGVIHPTGIDLSASASQFGSHPGGNLAATEVGSQHGPPPEAFGALPGGASQTFGTFPGGAPTFGTSPGGASQTFGTFPGGATSATFGSLPAPQGGLPTQTFEVRDFAAEDARAGERAASSVTHAPIDARIPKALVAITKLAMAKDPRDRYQTTAELRDDLDRYLNSGQASADAALRAQGWRRRLPLLAGVLGLLILGGGVAAYVTGDTAGAGPDPSATPSASSSPASASPSPSAATPSPSASAPSATPTPSFGPKPETLQAAVAKLPFVGSKAFPSALAAARHHYPAADLLKRLGQARSDLEELRKATSPASRATLSVRWLREHRGIPSDLKGPVALELTPRRFRPNPESAERELEFENLLRRQWYLATHVSWVDSKGTRLAVTDAFQLSVWDLSQDTLDRPQVQVALKKDQAWFTTFVSRSLPGEGPTEGVVFFSGSALVPDGRGGVLMKSRREPVRRAGFGRFSSSGQLAIGRFSEGVDEGTDRAICMDVSQDGRWLAAGTERGEVLLLQLGAGGSGGGLCVVRHDGERTDLQGVAFLEGGDLLSLAGAREEPSSLIRWRFEDLELREISRLSFGEGREPPASLIGLPGDQVLLGRADGRLVRIDCSDADQPPRVVEEVTLDELPPFAGSHGRTEWGPLTFVGTGQSRTYKRPHPQKRGGVLHAWRGLDQLESLASFRLSDPLDSFTSVALSPDGKRLAAGTISGEVLVWDLE